MVFGKSDNQNKKFDLIVNVSSKIEGCINSEGSVRIDGEIIGDLNCKGIAIIGKSAKVKGNIKADRIEISGSVEGDVSSKGFVKVYSEGILKGDIEASSLNIDENATFDGICHVAPQEVNPDLKEVTDEEIWQ